MELCEHFRNIMSVVFVVVGFVLHACYQDLLVSGFERVRVLSLWKLLWMLAIVVSLRF